MNPFRNFGDATHRPVNRMLTFIIPCKDT